MKAPDPAVGDSVYYVPRDPRNKPEWLRVEKIGRKWVDLQYHRRMDRESWAMEGSGTGYSSPGQCYRSKEDHDAVVMRDRRWRAIQEAVRSKWTAPDGVDLAEVERVLGLRSNKGD
jgi:hypothetical protein